MASFVEDLKDKAAHGEMHGVVMVNGKLVSGGGLQVQPAAPAPAPAPAPVDALDELGKLADLHDRGALTDAEFAAEKAKLLGA
jgi:hypothetical protein